MTSARLDSLFADLKSWLPSLLSQAVEKQAKQMLIAPQGPFPIAEQRELGLQAMRILGFDFDGGRLDISAHPFCGGVPQDVRITTRYNENDLLSALFGVIHETGHARYEQNLPRPWVDQPVGLARSTAIHESQSLFLKCSWDAASGFLTACYRRCASGLAIGRPLARQFCRLESAGETRLYSRRCR